jgi:hypothetical protein
MSKNSKKKTVVNAKFDDYNMYTVLRDLPDQLPSEDELYKPLDGICTNCEKAALAGIFEYIIWRQRMKSALKYDD